MPIRAPFPSLHHNPAFAQTVKSWPEDSAESRQAGARLADIVEGHIRWRLWHGQVQRTLDLIGETLGPLEAATKNATAPVTDRAGKAAEALRNLEIYVAEWRANRPYRRAA